MPYIEICVISVTMLCVLLLSNHRDTSHDWRRLRSVMIATIADLVLEMLCWVLDGHTFPYAREVLYALNTLTILTQAVMSFLWFYYACQLLGLRQIEDKQHRLIVLLPFLFNVIDLILNPLTHFRFILTSSNNYQLGSFAILDIAVTFIYPVAVTIIALKKARTESKEKRFICLTIASFLILPIIGLFFQSALNQSYLLVAFFAIGLLSIYINIQNHHITTDYLTKINNRNSLVTCYAKMQERAQSIKSLSLMVLDIDNFKKINDTCGHLAGDQALIKVATVLKSVCAGTHSFLARIGGDEFCILYEEASSEEIQRMITDIDKMLDDYNMTKELPVDLTLSIGYGTVEEVGSFDSLFMEADSMMYQKKREKKVLSPLES